jgi:carboxyl-terminal processing protease
VTVTVVRGKQEPFDITLTRQIITVDSVKSKLERGDIGLYTN